MVKSSRLSKERMNEQMHKWIRRLWHLHKYSRSADYHLIILNTCGPPGQPFWSVTLFNYSAIWSPNLDWAILEEFGLRNKRSKRGLWPCSHGHVHWVHWEWRVQVSEPSIPLVSQTWDELAAVGVSYLCAVQRSVPVNRVLLRARHGPKQQWNAGVSLQSQ